MHTPRSPLRLLAPYALLSLSAPLALTGCAAPVVSATATAIQVAADVIQILEFFSGLLERFSSSTNSAQRHLNVSVETPIEQRALGWENEWMGAAASLVELRECFGRVESHIEDYFERLESETKVIKSKELREEELKKNAELLAKWGQVREKFKQQITLAEKIEQEARDIKQVLMLAAMRNQLDQKIEYALGLHGRVRDVNAELSGLVQETRALLGFGGGRAPAASASARGALESGGRASAAQGGADVGISWVTIPAGSFQMGSISGGQDDERPVRTVTVRAFQMSRTEVTVGQYKRCVEAGVCTQPQWESCAFWDGSKVVVGVVPQSLRWDRQPVVCVDWGQARTFAKWVGADLPTEAEWEYAARGGQSFTYAGSDHLQEVAWYGAYNNSGNVPQTGGTRDVAQLKPNAYGLYDMSGNVWEWVLDEYKDSYNGAPSEGHQLVGSLPTCSTRCDNGAARRVLRGGGWYDGASSLRVANRYSHSPDIRYDDLGLRLRRTLP
ncbi:MAG: hypothetical protein FJ138_05885 [Deltaproteobacteria bacterium]|nr:hypothetical protein [Deltaproteobacteria bacterium]